MTAPTYEDLQARLDHIQDFCRQYLGTNYRDTESFALAAGVLLIAQHAIADPDIPIEERPNCQASKPFQDAYISCHRPRFHNGDHYDSQRKLVWAFGRAS